MILLGIALGLMLGLLAGGHRPIWERALTAAGFTLADVPSTFHVVLRATLDAGFLLHAGPIGDIIPIPVPVIRNVASVGDLFLSAGFAFFLFATSVRRYDESEELRAASADAGASLTQSQTPLGWSRPWSTGLSPGLAQASSL